MERKLMDEFFGIITEENCFLRSQPGEDRGIIHPES